MRKLNTSAISTTNAMPVKAGIWEHLQLAYQEGLAEIVKSLFGKPYDASKVYILNGVINSGSGSNYDISAGSVFYNGEIFLVDADSFSISGSNVATVVIDTSFFTDGVKADGVEFTDGVTRNIHEIRKAVITPGLSGSGIVNFVDMINFAYKPQGGIGQTVEWTMPGSGSQNSLLATYFDPTSLQGIHPLTLGWIIDDGGIVSVGYLAGDSDFGTIGHTGGEKTHKLTVPEGPTPPGTVPGLNGPHPKPEDGGGTPLWHPTGPLVASAQAANAHNNLQPFEVKLKIRRYY